jgi:hypothetical protein
MAETAVRKQKCAARINDQFDALLYMAEAHHDGEKFYFGTGLVTTDFHRWFGEQIRHAQNTDEGFDGKVRVDFEDGRLGRAMIRYVGKCDEAGSRISFVFHGDLVKKCTHKQEESTHDE